MIPLKDNIPTARFPVITVVLIAINVAVFVWQLGFPTDSSLERRYGFSEIDQSALEYGAIPHRITDPSRGDCAVTVNEAKRAAEIVCDGSSEFEQAKQEANADSRQFTPIDQAPWFVTLFTSMFMHGGFLHIIGNMLFLWVFGNNIEDSMGHVKFVAFYLLAGLAAVYSQAALDTGSTIPTIGASGAVAGVLGAYALLHPRARVLTLLFIVFFVTVVEIPAMILLGIWFVLQFLPAVGQVATPEVGGEGGVAYLAHVGGFIFGLIMIKLFARRQQQARLPVH